MTRTVKYLTTGVLFGLLVVSVAAIVLSEGALRVPERRRFAAHTEVAERIAAANQATWRQLQISAVDGAKLQSWEFRPAKWNGATVLAGDGVV